ncbi:transmembrane protein 174 [Xiphias gladius]|uniref:transmembrane protein 174 n=1 Tax=Xiphias gladius TaxID=8245 RepID=UPI001A985723|nr:transmembrane protein 174 [Xiphias gladius]
MDRQWPQGFWINMTGQRPEMETNRARNPTAVVIGPPDDPTQTVTPAPHPHQSDSLLDGEKTGASLLFSGVFLALIGVIFTVMGWQHYRANSSFGWTQMLGPILISVGGTFMLSSICKFGIISCWPCRQWDKEVLVMPVMEQTSRGHSITLSGINPPIMLHSATTMLCIPPAYNFITREVRRAIELQPGSFANGIQAALPPHDAVYCADNAAFTAEEDSSARSAETDCRRSRIEETEDESGRADQGGATCSPPPAINTSVTAPHGGRNTEEINTPSFTGMSLYFGATKVV